MVVTAGAVGWMIWFQWPTISNTNSSTTTTNSSTNTVTVNQNTNTTTNANTNVSGTAGWKTYVNSEGKYSISYPATWKATTSTIDPEVVAITPPDVQDKSSIELAPGITIAPEVKIDSSDCRNENITKNVSTITIKNKQFTRTISGCSHDVVTTYFPQLSPLTGYIGVNWADNFAKDYPEYEVILSTFSFTTSGTEANWKTYTNSTYKYSFDHPKTLTVSAASPEYLTGIYVPSGDYRGYEEGLQELSVTVFDHRHGQSLIVGQYDVIREPKTLIIAGRDARWGITEVTNESSGAKVVISQLQFFGKEQDLVVRVTEDGTLTPIIAEQLFKSLVVADTPSTTESYALSCDGMTFTTNTALTKASWWKKFSSRTDHTH
jgi:hypothetical protein